MGASETFSHGSPKVDEGMNYSSYSAEFFYSFSDTSSNKVNKICEDSFFEVPILAKIFMALSFTLTFTVCGFGDSLLCFFILRNKRLRTVTNLLIANLALSDVLVALICVPINLHYYLSGMNWKWGAFNCKLIGGLKVISMFVSVNTLLVIAIDRFIGIFWPLRPRIKKKTLLFIVIAIWVVSIIISLPTPILLVLKTGYFEDKEYSFCSEIWTNTTLSQLYISAIAIIEFIIPLCVMGVLYACIAKQLWFHRIPGNQTDRSIEISLIRKRRIYPMLITVVVAFFFCWAPYHVFNLTYQFHKDKLSCFQYQLTFAFIVESIAMLNSVFTTIIYLVMSHTFRVELLNLHKYILCGPSCDCRKTDEATKGRYQNPSRTGSNLSHTKNGSLNAARKNSRETAEARI